MQRILSRQGAPDTPDNQNRISTFAGSNPDVMDRYGMGLPPGLDDNSALLRLSLDKSIAKADGEPPPGRVEVGQPQMAPNQRPQAATPAPGPRNGSSPMGPNPQAPQYGYPQPGGTGQGGATLPGVNPIDVRGAEAGGRGTPAPSGQGLGPAHGTDAPGSGTFTANGPGGGGGSLMDWLLPALGLGGVGAAAYANRPQAPAAAPPVQKQLALPAPAPQLAPPQNIHGQNVPVDKNGWPVGATGQAPPIAMPDQSGPGGRPQQSAAEIQALKDSVAADNEVGARQLQDQMRKQNAQRETGDLIKRGARAVGRK